MNLTLPTSTTSGSADVWFRDLDDRARRRRPRRRRRSAAASTSRPGPARAASRAAVGLRSALRRRRARAPADGVLPEKRGRFDADVLVERPPATSRSPSSSRGPTAGSSARPRTSPARRPARSAGGTDKTYDSRRVVGLPRLRAGQVALPDDVELGRRRRGRRRAQASGMQLGGKWTDGTGMTENALVVDGRLSKISEELVDLRPRRLAAAVAIARRRPTRRPHLHAGLRQGRPAPGRRRRQRRRPVLRHLAGPHRARRRCPIVRRRRLGRGGDLALVAPPFAVPTG